MTHTTFKQAVTVSIILHFAILLFFTMQKFKTLKKLVSTILNVHNKFTAACSPLLTRFGFDQADRAKRCRYRLHYTLCVCLSVCVIVVISVLSGIFIVCVDKGIRQARKYERLQGRVKETKEEGKQTLLH